jgi:adenine-specific DNA-methyltransferase
MSVHLSYMPDTIANEPLKMKTDTALHLPHRAMLTAVGTPATPVTQPPTTNMLIHGDNVSALHWLLKDGGFREAIDLVYIDPPFASNNIFTISNNGRANTISSSRTDSSIAYSDTFSLQEFLPFLRVRLLLLRDLLSPQGSIYVHTDYKIGHYVKVLMDEVFGIEHFRNDITRIKCNPKNFARKGYSNFKDMILFYSKTSEMIWHEPKQAFRQDEIEKLYPKIDSTGRRYTTVPLHAPGETKQGASSKEFRGIAPPEGRHWRTDTARMEAWDDAGLIEWSSKGNPRKIIYADEQTGKRMQDVWDFKDPQYPVYPTEKPAELLDTIIATSSNPGSIVLDCFCGSGTVPQRASVAGRRWIAIDASDGAMTATQNKLHTVTHDLFSSSSYTLYTVQTDTDCIKT